MKVLPFEDGTPTVLSQIGEAVYGSGAFGEVLSYSLQAATMLILVLAANTGFADFPRLASFQAGDSFLPRQLTKRGHRLVFSNGIIALAGVAGILVVVTNAEVTKLIPLYAIGVFVGFTLSQAGMTRHHLRHREPGWRVSLVLNGIGAVISLFVVVVVFVTRRSDAWPMLIVMPVFVIMLLRLNKQYTKEAHHLEHDVPAAAIAPILRRHVVLVFVDRLDMASARAIQYARTLTPDEMRVVHFALDEDRAHTLRDEWAAHGSPADPPRDRRLPGSSPHPRRRRVRGPRAGRRRDRGLASCSPTGSTRASGTESSTTRPPTPSSRRSPGSLTPTSPPCRSTSTRSTPPRCRCPTSSGRRAGAPAGKGNVPPLPDPDHDGDGQRRPRMPVRSARSGGARR